MASKLVGLVFVLSLLLLGDHGKKGGGGGGADQPGFDVKVPNETQPPGGTVQVKFMPDPTSLAPMPGGTGRAAFDMASFSGIDGIALFSGTGDVLGAAVIQGTQVQVRFLSPRGTFGTSANYPLFTIALHVNPKASLGQQSILTLDPSTQFVNASNQPQPVNVKPGTFTAGGTVSISNVIPGGGAWPAGTVVRLLGTGFQTGTAVTAPDLRFSAVTLQSPSEIDLTLAQGATLDGEQIVVRNPDGSQDTYFSYLRGVPAARSAVPLFAATWPIFSTLTHTAASLGPLQALGSGQLYGLALQNPHAQTAQITLTLVSSNGAIIASSGLNLAFGARVAGALSEFFNGTVPAPGTTVRVSSSTPIQILGLLGDTSANAVNPINPTF